MKVNTPFKLMASGIRLCNFENSGRNVSGVYLRIGQLPCQCERNGSGTRANVDDSGIVHFLSKWHHGFNQMLGLRPGNKDGGSDNQVHSPEFLVPGDVLRRDTVSPLRESLVVAGEFLGRKFSLRVGIKVGAVAAQREHQ